MEIEKRKLTSGEECYAITPKERYATTTKAFFPKALDKVRSDLIAWFQKKEELESKELLCKSLVEMNYDLLWEANREAY